MNNNRVLIGFYGGALGAIVLVVIMYLLQAIRGMDPAFIGMYRAVFAANPPLDHIIAVILFVLSGGIWGMIFTLLVKDPTIIKGMLFGILPSLWIWVVVNPVIGKPLFNDFSVQGLLMPLLFNVVIWGTIVGWYAGSRIHPASTGSYTR